MVFTVAVAAFILSEPNAFGATPTSSVSEGPIINVRQFGAKGDNSADDTSAIQAGISAAIRSGQTFFIPKGTYRITRPIKLETHGLRILGASGVILKAAVNMSRMLYVCGSDIVISNLVLNGDHKAIYGLHAFHFNGVSSRLEFIGVSNAKSHGFFLDHSQVSEVKNCSASKNGGDGFYITDCNGMRISVCCSRNNMGRGFTVTATDFSGGCWLQYLNAEKNAREAVLVSTVAGTPIIMERLWAEGNSASSTNIYDGVRVVATCVAVSQCRITMPSNKQGRNQHAISLASETLLSMEGVSGQFEVGEQVQGQHSGAKAEVSLWQADPLFTSEFPIPAPYVKWLERPKKLMLRQVSGKFQDGEAVIAQQSKAQGKIAKQAVINASGCLITDNWLGNETAGGTANQVHEDKGCQQNRSQPNHRLYSGVPLPSVHRDQPTSRKETGKIE